MNSPATFSAMKSNRHTAGGNGTRALPAGAPVLQTRFMRIDGRRIAYDDTGGPGRVILGIPGMGDLRAAYRTLRPALQRAGFRVVTMDVRGHGESSARWSDYSARAVGRDALALLAHLNAGPAVILGSSFAAGSALWAAHDSPAQVAGVGLLGPVVRDLKSSWFARLALKIGFAGPWRVWVWTTYWDSLFPRQKPADQDRIKAAIAANLREPGRMMALQTMLGLSKAETATLVGRSRVPALVVMGTRDPDFPDAVAEAHWLAAQLHAEVSTVDGAGHYPHTETPDEVVPKLLAFINGLDAAA